MAIIKLTKGHITQVDDDMYPELSAYNWYASGLEGRPARRLRLGPRKIIFIYHQILCVLPWVINEFGFVVDHVDGDPLNNQKANLRVISRKENMRNTTRYGLRQGYCHDGTHNKWKVYIDQPDLPRINIGTFSSEEEAKQALFEAKTRLGLQ